MDIIQDVKLQLCFVGKRWFNNNKRPKEIVVTTYKVTPIEAEILKCHHIRWNWNRVSARKDHSRFCHGIKVTAARKSPFRQLETRNEFQMSEHFLLLFFSTLLSFSHSLSQTHTHTHPCAHAYTSTHTRPRRIVIIKTTLGKRKWRNILQTKY